MGVAAAGADDSVVVVDDEVVLAGVGVGVAFVVCPAAFDDKANMVTTKAAQNITNDRSDCRWARSIDINSPLTMAVWRPGRKRVRRATR
jgi:hypothetical protein